MKTSYTYALALIIASIITTSVLTGVVIINNESKESEIILYPTDFEAKIYYDFYNVTFTVDKSGHDLFSDQTDQSFSWYSLLFLKEEIANRTNSHYSNVSILDYNISFISFEFDYNGSGCIDDITFAYDIHFWNESHPIVVKNSGYSFGCFNYHYFYYYNNLIVDSKIQNLEFYVEFSFNNQINYFWGSDSIRSYSGNFEFHF